MACYHPWTAYRPRAGGPLLFAERGDCDPVTLACGQCVGCRLERSRQWAMRCMHEAQMWPKNSFVTLTYRTEEVPPFGSLFYPHYQNFMKRLRKEVYPEKVRFYMCGEYGEELARPHYHALLFNCGFDDRLYIGRSPGGSKLYRSGLLERLWPHGFSAVGDVTFESAAYVARYVMKKITGQKAEEHYGARAAEFNRMSLGGRVKTGGIGASWLAKFFSDVYPAGKCVVNGHETNSPRYYDKYYGAGDADGLASLAYSRVVEAKAHYSDNVDERLSVKEKVTRARLSRLKRVL